MQEEELNLCSADGTGIGAFYVRQARSTGQKAVLLLTDILGYKNEDTRDVARRIAEIGFPTSKLVLVFKVVDRLLTYF